MDNILYFIIICQQDIFSKKTIFAKNNNPFNLTFNTDIDLTKAKSRLRFTTRSRQLIEFKLSFLSRSAQKNGECHTQNRKWKCALF